MKLPAQVMQSLLLACALGSAYTGPVACTIKAGPLRKHAPILSGQASSPRQRPREWLDGFCLQS